MKPKSTLFVLLFSTFVLTSVMGQHLESGYGSEVFGSSTPKVELSQPYPNPASHKAAVRYNLGTLSKGKINVYNLLGTRLKSYNLPRNHGEIQIPVHELTPGMYFLRLQVDGKETLMRKLKVMR